MAYEYERLDVSVEDGVAFATIKNPPINVITLHLFSDLSRFAQEVASDDSARAVVLRSDDPDFFIAHFDVSAILGSIAVQNIETYRQEMSRRLAYLRDDDNAGDDDLLRQNLSEAFSGVLTLVKAIDGYFFRLPAENAFRSGLGNEIETKLAPSLHRLLAYLKGAESLGLSERSDLTEFSFGLPV